MSVVSVWMLPSILPEMHLMPFPPSLSQVFFLILSFLISVCSRLRWESFWDFSILAYPSFFLIIAYKYNKISRTWTKTKMTLPLMKTNMSSCPFRSQFFICCQCNHSLIQVGLVQFLEEDKTCLKKGVSLLVTVTFRWPSPLDVSSRLSLCNEFVLKRSYKYGFFLLYFTISHLLYTFTN